MKDGLTPAQESFAAGIASGMTQAEAYRQAFPKAARWKDETVWAEASRLAADHKVSTRVRELMQKAAAANEVTVERVLKEAARIALFDPRKLLNDDGTPKGLHELDDDTAAGIAGLDVLDEFDWDEEGRKTKIGVVRKYKLADKNAALEKLFKFLGMYERDNKQKVDPLAEVLRQMGASALPVAKVVSDD